MSSENHNDSAKEAAQAAAKITAETILALNDKGQEIELQAMDGWPGGGYRLESAHVGAIQAAYFANRPLLVRGDPGLGKSQLAQAIASALDWGLVSAMIHYDTSIEELLYSQDHLERLYHANQGLLSAAVDKVQKTAKEQAAAQDGHGHDKQATITDHTLAPVNYIRPGKIWQAMAPGSVEEYKVRRPHKKPGTVLLIDEIDKADSTLPNALLEVLDKRCISVNGLEAPITQGDHPMFVVITSNDERLLPQAFLRRCAVLELHLEQDETAAIKQLKQIYATHQKYDKTLKEALDDKLVEHAAGVVIKQRDNQRAGEYHSGTSEFLDIIRALYRFPRHDVEQSIAKLDLLAENLVNKNQQRG